MNHMYLVHSERDSTWPWFLRDDWPKQRQRSSREVFRRMNHISSYLNQRNNNNHAKIQQRKAQDRSVSSSQMTSINGSVLSLSWLLVTQQYLHPPLHARNQWANRPRRQPPRRLGLQEKSPLPGRLHELARELVYWMATAAVIQKPRRKT